MRPYPVADLEFPIGGEGGAEPLGGGANLRRGHILAKTYVKMKELDPDGGGGAPAAPPGFANDTTEPMHQEVVINSIMLFD